MKIWIWATLLFATGALAQVTCQTAPYNRYAGTTTTCNGTLQPPPTTTQQVQPVQNYGAVMSSAAQANAAQTAANAQLLQAQVQAQLARQQAELVRQQTEFARQQTEALKNQETNNSQRREALQSPSPQDTESLHDAVLGALAADTVSGLRAKAATLEAVLRNSPPDSDSFRNATGALLAVNTELAKRGELISR